MASMSCLEAPFLDVTVHLIIVHSKIKKVKCSVGWKGCTPKRYHHKWIHLTVLNVQDRNTKVMYKTCFAICCFHFYSKIESSVPKKKYYDRAKRAAIDLKRLMHGCWQNILQQVIHPKVEQLASFKRRSFYHYPSFSFHCHFPWSFMSDMVRGFSCQEKGL